MDLIARLFFRLGVLLEQPRLRPIPVPVRNAPPRPPGARR